MYFVHHDTDGDWYFDNGVYKRMDGDKLRGKIGGEQIPNPFMINLARKRMHPAARDCTKATYALWSHWQHVIRN